MPIAFTEYVNITSGIGAGATVRRRELIARLITTTPEVPPDRVLEFTDIVDIADYFGRASEEYRRAIFYFGFVSKIITRPQKISFARYTPTAVAPRIFGVSPSPLATFRTISDGAFVITIGGASHTVSSLDLSSASSLADVATAVQGAIRTGSGTQFVSSTVAHSADRNRFEFTGGTTGEATISVAPAESGTDLLMPLGWSTGAVLTSGADDQSPVDAIANSAEQTNNFGSFTFLPALDLAEINAVAAWNLAQNVQYQFYVPVTATNAAQYFSELQNLGGTGLILTDNRAGEWPEMLPMSAMAAIDFDRQNSTINFMFQQSDLTPLVTTTAEKNRLDALRVNYYGNTQTAGQTISFFQNGVLLGTGTSPIDMNTFANEQWLKSAAGAAIMTLMLNIKISANSRGRAQVLSAVRSVVTVALLNGTISLGRTLSTTQRLFITETAGNELAWQQIQNAGYWLNATIGQETDTAGTVTFSVNYIIIYAKDDVIRRVEGTHILV